VVGINGALLPFGRAAAPVFSRAARVLAAAPVFPQLVALHAVPRKPVERMLRQTGSATPEEMVRCYRRLLGSSRHVAGTLRMMANWDLVQLERNLARLEPRLCLLVGEGDRVVDPAQADELHARLPASMLRRAPGLGHLGHEEAPAWFEEQIRAIAAEARAA
jgi:magnesium chelatase accessory protein